MLSPGAARGQRNGRTFAGPHREKRWPERFRTEMLPEDEAVGLALSGARAFPWFDAALEPSAGTGVRRRLQQRDDVLSGTCALHFAACAAIRQWVAELW